MSIITHEQYNVNFMEVAEVLRDGILVLDTEGYVVDVNAKYLDFTGLSKEALIGMHANELIAQDLISQDATLDVLNAKVPTDSYFRHYIKDRMHLITSMPFFRDDGKLAGVFVCIRDVSAMSQLQVKLAEAEREKQESIEELTRLRNLQERTELIGESACMNSIKELILNIASTDAAIMITGETGVGKEVVAKAIHHNSQRSNRPYIKINCAAIPESLLESELFGYEAGAFTGAQSRGKQGLFELADGGTLLLDEVGEMPRALQPKLLRVLQEQEVRRLGSTKTTPVDVRIISATNVNLHSKMSDGSFREDLYYRLNIVPIEVPPLRDRKDDILLLSNRFLSKFNIKYNRKKYLTLPAIFALEEYNWPGNIRELQNSIERLVVINEDKMITDAMVNQVLLNRAIPLDNMPCKNVMSRLDDAVESMERRMISRALAEQGSTYKAAAALGITQSKLMRRIAKYDLALSKDV